MQVIPRQLPSSMILKLRLICKNKLEKELATLCNENEFKLLPFGTISELLKNSSVIGARHTSCDSFVCEHPFSCWYE